MNVSELQLEASSLLSNLSMSLVSLTLSEGDDKEVTRQAVTPIIQAASNILKVSASTDKQVSDSSGKLAESQQ